MQPHPRRGHQREWYGHDGLRVHGSSGQLQQHIGKEARQRAGKCPLPHVGNLALHINGTFKQTFGQASTDASWESKCPSGGVSEEVILQLEKFTNGCRPGPGNFLSFSTEYPAVDGYVKCSGACGSCGKRLGVCTDPAEFLESVKGHSLCTDVATVRAYMFCFLDANSFFLGTGYDAGASGPESPEWVTLPNLPYKEAGDISIYRFGASGTCQTRLG